MTDWRDWEERPAKPIAVEGGLTARSTRGEIGRAWWSRRFIEVMESFALGTRLTRGRAYARKGQVISLDVEPGAVTASVQGSRVTPYRVRIGLDTFSELAWAKAEVALAEQALHAARLLAGEFPPELEAVFAQQRAPLFPARLADLRMSCSCPDSAVPCKHIAATLYLLAERFDDDPFQILLWRGRERERLLTRLAELRGEETREPDESPPTPTIHAPVLTAGLALEEGPAASRATTTDAIGAPALALTYWTAGVLPDAPARPDLPVDLLLRALPPPPPGLGGSRLIGHLGPLYERFAARPE